MRGLKLNFDEGGAVLDPSTAVEEHSSTAQNGLVIIGTSKGSAPLKTDKGTNLLKDITSRSIPGVQEAQHIANFAALDTLFFSRANEFSTLDTSFEEVRLSVEEITTSGVSVSTLFRFIDDTEIGSIESFDNSVNS